MLLRRSTLLSNGNFMAHLIGYPLFDTHNNLKKFKISNLIYVGYRHKSNYNFEKPGKKNRVKIGIIF